MTGTVCGPLLRCSARNNMDVGQVCYLPGSLTLFSMNHWQVTNLPHKFFNRQCSHLDRLKAELRTFFLGPLSGGILDIHPDGSR